MLEHATEPVVEEQPEIETVEVVEVVEVVKPVGPGFASDNSTPVDASGSPVSRTFYFDFDQAVVSPADFAALQVHAEILRANPDRKLVVAGHCDQRGTREYNLALGERRAKAIRAILRPMAQALVRLKTSAMARKSWQIRRTMPEHGRRTVAQ